MFEIVKLKYLKQIKNRDNVILTNLVQNVLTQIQKIVSNDYYSNEELIKAIFPLKGIDNKLYDIIKKDIEKGTLWMN